MMSEDEDFLKVICCLFPQKLDSSFSLQCAGLATDFTYQLKRNFLRINLKRRMRRVKTVKLRDAMRKVLQKRAGIDSQGDHLTHNGRKLCQNVFLAPAKQQAAAQPLS